MFVGNEKVVDTIPDPASILSLGGSICPLVSLSIQVDASLYLVVRFYSRLYKSLRLSVGPSQY